MSTDFSKDNYDWKISDSQYRMITDKVSKLSKKEASLIIKIVQAVFDSRASEMHKHKEGKLD